VAELMAGSSQVDITPPLPVTLGGMFLSYKTEKVRDRLYSECVSIKTGSTVVIIMGCDIAMVTEEITAAVRAKVKNETGVESNNIIITATHTHTGPFPGYYTVFKSEEQVKEDRKVIDILIERICRSAVEAFRNMKPAKMGYGSGNAERCCFNRRYIMSDGKSEMNPWGVDNPDRLRVEGPVDEQLQTVWFEDMEGEIITILVNLSTHAAMLYGKEYISADFPGVMRKTVWGALGREFPILYLQGACGNVGTFDFEHDDNWGKHDDGYRHIGRIIAGEVIKLISLSRAESEEICVSTAGKTIYIPFREFDSEETEKAEKLLENAEKSRDLRQYIYDKIKTLPERAHFNTLTSIIHLKKKYPEYPIEISAVKIGDIFIVTNPAELFVEYQLELKKRYSDYKVIMAELTNGWCSYVPTRLAIALGGYETMQRRLSADAGRLIVDTSSELIEKLAGKG
jgi:neutral ceramidase